VTKVIYIKAINIIRAKTGENAIIVGVFCGKRYEKCEGRG
jgi:hypothetical protein